MIAIVSRRWRGTSAHLVPLLGILGFLGSGCGEAGDQSLEGSTEPVAPVVVTTAPALRQPVERSIEVVGTLFGWEEVTLGSKQTGRVIAVKHDVGDRVNPGDSLVELDPVDARFAVEESRSRLLGELVKLGISSEVADRFTSQYGISEAILENDEVIRIIRNTPPVKQAQATLELAEIRLNRQRQLASRSAGTVQELQDAESEVRVAEAALDNAILTARTVIANALSTYVAMEQATEVLREMTIEAPKPSVLPPGVETMDSLRYAISQRHVAEGQFLRPGDPVYDLVLEHPLRLRANVPERFGARVAEGQVVEISVASYPGKTFQGTISRINPRIDPVSRTFEVEATVANEELILRPGSFAKARIVTQREDDATLVPIEAVVRFAGVVKLFLIDPASGGDRVSEVQVRTGVQSGDMIEILDGLPEGSVVVTSGQTRLADGSTVVLRENLDSRASEKDRASVPEPDQNG
ncbi:efflux RND transporter periplasmic adaptor subunit [Tautonia marina]|uniref:efflux RND transporter periplasmic adaptor subunit n=1 Tax=Tautonia marina TaxID=2653855 RepID=UPI00126078D8|nr:efflux RND transporter periplasmic adaptor subunit [Tautonia marina]